MDEEIKVGDRVRHSEHGAGVVKDIDTVFDMAMGRNGLEIGAAAVKYDSGVYKTAQFCALKLIPETVMVELPRWVAQDYADAFPDPVTDSSPRILGEACRKALGR